MRLPLSTISLWRDSGRQGFLYGELQIDSLPKTLKRSSLRIQPEGLFLQVTPGARHSAAGRREEVGKNGGEAAVLELPGPGEQNGDWA